MTEVAILGDTHVPSREPGIPEWVRERVRAADRAIHTGDFDDLDALVELRELARDLTAVRGNMDPGQIGLSRVETLDVGDVRFVVTHGTGAPRSWADRVAATARENAGEGTTVGVAGHTHELVDRDHDGVRLLNPGSATGASPAEEETMLVATADGADLSVEVLRG